MTSQLSLRSLKRVRGGVGLRGPGPRPSKIKVQSAVSRSRTYLIFVTPSILLLALINLYPVLYAGWQTLHNGDLVSSGMFVGFHNYITVIEQSDFWKSAGFTILFTVVGVFGSWTIGLALALFLRTVIPAGGLFKVILLLPWIVPTVVSATSWNWLVATPESPVPVIARSVGLGDVLFLADPTLAQVTVCAFKVWISFPFMMMLMSSALAAVDGNIYEAAKVDGAGSWKTFLQITLPLISRTTYVSWILMTIFCVNDFPTIFLLTGGGPVNATQSLVVLAYQTVFQDYQVGPGVAIAFIMTLVLVVISTVLYRQIRKGHTE